MKTKLHLTLPVIFIFIASPAWSDFAKTPQERQLCDSLGISNHECDCVRFINRAYSTINNKAEFKYNLGEAVGGCNYNLSHSGANNPWAPNAHFQIGLAMKLQNNPIGAITSFGKTLELNPRHQQAYSEMANIYFGLKNKKKALEMATEGLRWIPNSKPLQRQYNRAGGTLPYPTPYEKVNSTPPAEIKEPPSSPKDTPTSDTPTPPLPEPQKVIETTQPTQGKSQSEQQSSEPIGSPKNPWCRFCPDTPAKADPLPSNP